jgi:hypothetical protein
MANYYTTYATSQNSALTDQSASPNVRQNGGTVQHIDVTVALTALTTSDVLYLFKLPAGARLLPNLCSVDYGDPGDALTGNIGDEADTDRYGAALALGNAAGRKEFSEAGTKGAAFLTPFTQTGASWLTFTPTTVTSFAAHTQTWHLAYTLG